MGSKKLIIAPSSLLLALYLVPLEVVSAAGNGTIGVNPKDGSSYETGKSFIIDMIIDGKGDSFNAAKATVIISSSLQVNDLILGDCNFSFIQTPQATDPSFVGIILGGSSKKCTAYTLTLTPPPEETGSINLSNASIKKYGDASEILNSVQNGTYTIAGTTPTNTNIVNNIVQQIQNLSENKPSSTPTPIPTTTQEAPTSIPSIQQSQEQQASAPASYTLSLEVLKSNNEPLSDATVAIDPPQYSQAISQPVTQTTTTDKKGTAQLNEINPGIHIIKVEKSGKLIAEKIINVAGNNPVLVLGIKEQKQTIDWTITLLIAIPLFMLSLFLFNHFALYVKLQQSLSLFLKKK